MRTLVLNITFVFILVIHVTTAVFAQSIADSGRLKGKHVTYELVERHDDLGLIVVSNRKNVMVKTKQLQPMDYGRAPDPNTLVIDKHELISLVSGSFTQSRLDELAKNEEGFRIWMYFNLSGELKEVKYSLSEQTLLTAVELEKMEKCIIKNIRGKFITDEWKNGNYVMLDYFITYRALLEH